MREGINNPAHGRPLHPGADLGDGLTTEEQGIISISKGSEGAAFHYAAHTVHLDIPAQFKKCRILFIF